MLTTWEELRCLLDESTDYPGPCGPAIPARGLTALKATRYEREAG
jgi:hypothetical protein